MTDQHMNERVRAVVEGPLATAGFEVVDVVRQGSILQVTVDLLVGAGDAHGGIDLDGVTEATRLVSDLLDGHDLVGERTTLEVSSPGVERPLRTPEHFRRFVGTEVAVKLRPTVEGERRLAGVLQEADDDGVRVAGRRVAYVDIERARTVFVWPPRSEHAGSRRTAAKKMGRAS
ncbi:MAG: hypothetical protein JWM47_3205 [Acidimicrobiales bacterium]|nr:hypothetical protein [Acidimicrobiales bacterium]